MVAVESKAEPLSQVLVSLVNSPEGGRSTASRRGGLQELAVCEAICEILEGGRLAFEERYRRIGEGQ